MIGQRKPRRNVLNKWFKTAMRTRLRGSPSESARVSIHKYCSLFPLNKFFTHFTTFHLCGNSSLQSQRARASITDHWSSGFTANTQPQPLAGNPGPAPSHCKLRPPENIPAGKIVQIKFFRILKIYQRLEKIQGTST